MFTRLLLVLWLLPAFVAAKDTSRLANIETAWLGWMEEHNISHSTLAVLRNGEPELTTSIGRPEFEPIPLASLGKAITGSCVRALVGQGVLRYSTTVSDVLGTAVSGGQDLSIAELLTHSTGLAPDATQAAMPKWKRVGTPQHDTITQTALSRRVQTGTRGRYAYNNENYAILGLIIERVTKQSYETACRDLVLKPAGVTTAKLPKLYGAFGAMGGWWMTADDYGRFVHHNYRGGFDPTTEPNIEVGGGAFYGLGVVFREWRSGFNYWHFGALCFRKGSSQSYFASWEGGLTVVVGFDACLDFGTLGTLDRVLSTTALR